MGLGWIKGVEGFWGRAGGGAAAEAAARSAGVRTSATGASSTWSAEAAAVGPSERVWFSQERSMPYIGPKAGRWNFLSRMAESGGAKAALGMGLVGGVASYATGGEFGQGAVVGAAFGFAGRSAYRALRGNMTDISAATSRVAESKKSRLSGAAGLAMKHGPSLNRVQERHAMLAGAGLFGVLGGGSRNRPNHRRGFNSHRGNSF